MSVEIDPSWFDLKYLSEDQFLEDRVPHVGKDLKWFPICLIRNFSNKPIESRWETNLTENRPEFSNRIIHVWISDWRADVTASPAAIPSSRIDSFSRISAILFCIVGVSMVAPEASPDSFGISELDGMEDISFEPKSAEWISAKSVIALIPNQKWLLYADNIENLIWIFLLYQE